VRRIAHLSDLHFGRTDPTVVRGVIDAVARLGPDLTVISGDLTQRARAHQFRAARAFLDRLPKPQIVVPGNHDIPLWNIFARGFSPLRKYRRIITRDLEPFFADGEIAVLGLNTARSLTIKDGRVNRRQIDVAVQRFSAGEPHCVRVLVTHHPFDQPDPDHPERGDAGDIVGRAVLAMDAIGSRVDLILSGHLHLGRSGSSALRYPGSGALLILAGTATSTRVRGGEPNAFNLLELDRDRLVLKRQAWDAARRAFAEASRQDFRRSDGVWREEAPPDQIRSGVFQNV
jgi:3',5'-cyclic AMP phosphodiesterase CpdA